MNKELETKIINKMQDREYIYMSKIILKDKEVLHFCTPIADKIWYWKMPRKYKKLETFTFSRKGRWVEWKV